MQWTKEDADKLHTTRESLKGEVLEAKIEFEAANAALRDAYRKAVTEGKLGKDQKPAGYEKLIADVQTKQAAVIESAKQADAGTRSVRDEIKAKAAKTAALPTTRKEKASR